MFCSKLSMLTVEYSIDLVVKIDNWIARLSPYARKVITVSKLANGIGIEYFLAQAILEKMTAQNILVRRFSTKCPECDTTTAVISENELADYLAQEFYCYSCDYRGLVNMQDIEVVYEYLQPCDDGASPNFNTHPIEKDGVGIASNKKSDVDTILFLLNNTDFNVNNLLYQPTDEDYCELKRQLKCVLGPHKTTTDKGNSLEQFIQYLFNICKVFKAIGVRTENNQIDCAVTVNCVGLNNSALKYLGKAFVIECKNENKTPAVSYLQKLRDIVNMTNQSTGLVSMGLLCCIKPAPKTFPQYANRYYLADKNLLISLCLSDYEKIINDRVNLLDLIDEKVLEIILSATQPLGIIV